MRFDQFLDCRRPFRRRLGQRTPRCPPRCPLAWLSWSRRSATALRQKMLHDGAEDNWLEMLPLVAAGFRHRNEVGAKKHAGDRRLSRTMPARGATGGRQRAFSCPMFPQASRDGQAKFQGGGIRSDFGLDEHEISQTSGSRPELDLRNEIIPNMMEIQARGKHQASISHQRPAFPLFAAWRRFDGPFNDLGYLSLTGGNLPLRQWEGTSRAGQVFMQEGHVWALTRRPSAAGPAAQFKVSEPKMAQLADVGRQFLNAAMSAPYLGREEERSLAFRWKNNNDEEALHDLTRAHMRLVIALALRFRHYGLPVADLIQEGHVGLLEAAARFEPEREVRFSTYATWWIRASMQNYVLHNWSIVRGGTSSAQKSLFFNLRRTAGEIGARVRCPYGVGSCQFHRADARRDPRGCRIHGCAAVRTGFVLECPDGRK